MAGSETGATTEARVAELEAQVADLKALLDGDGPQPRGSTHRRVDGSAQRTAVRESSVSRRRMLIGGAAAAAATAAVVAGTQTRADAWDGDPLTVGESNSQTDPTQLSVQTCEYGLLVWPAVDAPFDAKAEYRGVAVAGRASGRTSAPMTIGVCGHGLNGQTGVYGKSDSGIGVLATTTTGTGVRGESSSDYGVYGLSGSSYGTAGRSTSSIGVVGVSVNQTGVYGVSEQNKGYGVQGQGALGVVGFAGSTRSGLPLDHAGVVGDAYGNDGVVGLSQNGSGVRGVSGGQTGVTGIGNNVNGDGVHGFGGITGVAGFGDHFGLLGVGGKGLGAQLTGGRAALNLVPTKAAGHPTTGAHGIGDIVIDKNGAMFLCTKAGTPGTWAKVTVAAV